MLAALLLVPHLDWPPFTSQLPAGVFAVAECLLAISMLLFVFREARARAQRLVVLRSLTDSIVLAQQQGGMMEKALEALQQLTKSKAAWFRLIEGGHLVATHAVGVSQDFLREVALRSCPKVCRRCWKKASPWHFEETKPARKINIC